MEDKFGWIILSCIIVLALVFLFSPRIAGLFSQIDNTVTSTTTITKTYDTFTEQYCPRELRMFLGQEKEVEFNENKSEARVDTEKVLYYCQAYYNEELNKIKIQVEREEKDCAGSVCSGVGIRTLVIAYDIYLD